MRVAASLAWLFVADRGIEAVYGEPPIRDHDRAAAEMAAELGFPLDYDEPPKAVRMTRPTYPTGAFEGCLEGTVVLLIGIDATGTVRASKVVESIDGLDEAALACVRNWRFKPAIKGGVAVGTVAMAPISFKIDDEKAKGKAPCHGRTGTQLPSLARRRQARRKQAKPAQAMELRSYPRCWQT